MRYVVSASLVIVAIIHLMPLVGVLGVRQLTRLYDVTFDEPNAEILMRHRAVLFGLLGVFLLGAAFLPAAQPAALLAAFVSVLSFLWLARSVGGRNQAVGRVVSVDVFALLVLLAGAAALLLDMPRP